MATERIIGIDFGTSTSVVRVKRYENGKPVGEKLETKEVIFSGIGATVPTLIQKKEGEESVSYYGYEAQQKRKKHTTYHSFKVDLESGDPDKKAQARKLTEEFFAYVRKQYCAQSDGGHLGDSGDKERTIISYPVKWSEETRKFMLEAAKKAGFPNVTGMDEAQAAIHAVTIMSEDHLLKNDLLVDGVPSNILLVDMGAGTTDLVLCRHTPGAAAKTEILATWPTQGEILFGGREVDSLLQGFFREIMGQDNLERALKSVGVDQFKAWKENSVSPALAKNDAVTDFFALDNYADIVGFEMDEYSLDRAGFEKCLGDYLKQLPELINGCLNSVGMKGSDVDLVIVTGGHSQWYFVKEMLIGKMPQFGELSLEQIQKDASRMIPITRPQETVALGLVYSPIQVVIAEKKAPVVAAVEVNEVTIREPVSNQNSNVALLAPVKKNGKWGYIDQTGKLVIPCQWDKADPFSDGFAVVKDKEGFYYIDKRGTRRFPVQSYREASSFRERRAAVKSYNKYGYIDVSGNLVIPFRYDKVSDFSDNRALVKRDKSWYIIDNNGNEIRGLGFNYIDKFSPGETYGFSDGVCRVGGCSYDVDGNYLNRTDKIDVVGAIFMNAEYLMNKFSEGLRAYRKYRDRSFFNILDDTQIVVECGYVDKKGNVKLCNSEWVSVGNFSEGLAHVRNKNGTICYIDREGHSQITIPDCVNTAGPFLEGIASVDFKTKDVPARGEKGYLCKNGKLLFDGYQDAKDFSFGFGAVRKNEKWGFVNKRGDLVIPCEWDSVEHFSRVYFNSEIENDTKETMIL